MARNMLKRYGRFELLELIYNMRKDNLELRERCEKAEKEVADTKAEMERRLETARTDFESRIEELRMQGAAKDLQIRMKKIEEQLRVMQKLTSEDVDLNESPNPDEIRRLAEDIESRQTDRTAETGEQKPVDPKQTDHLTLEKPDSAGKTKTAEEKSSAAGSKPEAVQVNAKEEEQKQDRGRFGRKTGKR